MKRIAIIGGGIAGVSAAYELAMERQAGAAIEFALLESAPRLGGIVETIRRDDFVIEGGPDSWVTEKPWARDLALELGLESGIVASQDDRRRTYLAKDRTLIAMPDGMRMMVPGQWASVLNSPLFSWQAKLAYLREAERAEELKASALGVAGSVGDESVRDFVCRHFGAEVADTMAAPLLAGVFGGDIVSLSTRAVLPALVALEKEHGSLILGLQHRMRTAKVSAPVFTTLRQGLGSLIDAMELRIPEACVHRGVTAEYVARTGEGWVIGGEAAAGGWKAGAQPFDAVLVATPAKTTAKLLGPLDEQISGLLPQQSSSAIVVALAFSVEKAAAMRIPRGFGFLVPRIGSQSDAAGTRDEDAEAVAARALLACTFVDQKFPYRASPGGVLLRAFFGGSDAMPLLAENDVALMDLAHTALGRILGKLPEPSIALVRRWPDSLPLYAVGHLARMDALDTRIARLPHLRVVGNAYRGVGLPDLIHAGRMAARTMVAELAEA